MRSTEKNIAEHLFSRVQALSVYSNRLCDRVGLQPCRASMFTKSVCFLQRRGGKLSFFATMAQNQENFHGKLDRYNGITVDSKDEPCELTIFPSRLEASLDQWLKEKRRTIWFRVDLSQTYWIPELTKRGFKFHHAKEEQTMLYRWLPQNETCNVPPYAHTNLGVGAVVLNEKTREILVIKERHGFNNNWKLPGGYVEPGENLTDAVEREVLEETGIVAKFKCMLAFRHAHEFIFGCSDIYTISYLEPQTFDIVKCKREINDCEWMKLENYVAHPNVHENNRFMASKVLEFLNHRMGITMNSSTHPTLKKEIYVYSVNDTKNVEQCQ